jgi:uncharacterized membrane protein YkvA (DUF1232 family)
MQIERIRAQIEEAKAFERQAGLLYQAVVNLAQQNGANVSALQVGKVIDFVAEYVESAPSLMLIVEDAARENGAQGCIQPLLDAIEEFFLAPDGIIPDHLGLIGLLDDAYLAHTLLEAISDKYRSQNGKSLLPKDAYETNIFIRRLIGEPFVGMLDEHVAKTLEGMCKVQEIDQMLGVLEQMQLSPVRKPMRGSLRVTEITGVHL